MDTTTGRIKAFLLSLALVTGALLATPAEPLQASDCGGNGKLCSETEACVGWLWAKVCTTTYEYVSNCTQCHVYRVKA